MLVRVKITDDLWIEQETEKEVDTFKALSRIQEVFKHDKCGKCGSTNVRFVCRKDKDENDWLEIVCKEMKCGCKLIFGQTKGKGGEIYPKIRWNNLSATQQEQRADEKDYAEGHGGFLPNGGWFKYKGNYRDGENE